MHDNVEVDDPPFGGVTLDGLKLQDSPVDGDTDDVRATALLNPFRLAIVIVELAGDPVFADTDIGLAVNEKSAEFPTVRVTVVECVNDPLVPVTVTVTVPEDEPDSVRVELADPPPPTETLAGENVAVTPLGALVVRAIVPENRDKLVKVTVVLTLDPT